MSTNLKRRIRRIVTERTAESQSETVSEETLKEILCGNAGIEPADVEVALGELVEDGTLARADDEYGLSTEA